MALIRFRVDPPEVNEPLYGLLDVAEVVDDATAHWRAGVEYDTVSCHESKVWGPWCTGSTTPQSVPVIRTLSVSLNGTAVADPDGFGPITVEVAPDPVDPTGFTAEATWDATAFAYGLIATASVDGGPIRQVTVSVDTGTREYTETFVTSGGGAIIINPADGPVPAIDGVITITDVLTGVAIRLPIQQNDDGTIATPTSPILIAVEEAAIPPGCDSISTVFTAAPNPDGDAASISVTSTTGAADPRELVLYIGSVRAVINTGAATPDVVTGLAPGLYRIAVRDVDSWSYVSGWLRIGDDFTGTATLVQSTCPVKDIGSPPWQNLDADPFVIFAEVQCKTLGFPDAAESALEALNLSQHRTLERVYWETLIDRAQALAGGAGVSVTRAVAELEQYIASVYNGMGFIHTSPWGVAYLAAAGVLDDTATGDERLRTWRGTPVVVGSGYFREGTDTAAGPEDFWMFITGAVQVRVSDPDVFEALDKATNDLSALAERTFVVIDDCPIPGSVHVTPVVTP